MGRDRDNGARPRKFGRIDPFCLLAAIPLAVVGVALVFSDVVWLAPVLLLLAAGVIALDSWLHRPGRLVDPKVAKAALRRNKETREGGSSEIRRGPRSQAGRSSTGAARRQTAQARGQSDRSRSPEYSYRQSGARQQPRARQQAPAVDYRARERGRY